MDTHMDSDTDSSGTITVSRDYDRNAVVVETNNHTKRLAPTAARTLAKAIRTGQTVPMSPFTGGEPLVDELLSAADDVEHA